MNNSAKQGRPEYLEAWSLRSHPFEERLNNKFFYAGNTLTQRLDLLTHLVQFGESIIIVSGPAGSGKSSLLEQFLGHINPQWAICLMDGKQGDQLSGKLAETIGGSPDDDAQELLNRWAAHKDTSQHMLIVLDNAEELDASACQWLCELTSLPNSEHLRVVLFGTAETQQRVRATLEQLNSKRTCQVLEVPKLSEEETASYLMYRLAVAGYSGESPFTPTEVRAMCKAADGRPGKINRLAHESLIEHHLRSKIKKRAPVRRGPKKNTAPLWIGASIAIAAISGYLGWQRLVPTDEPDHGTTPSEQAFTKLPLDLPATPLPANNAEDAPAPLPDPPAENVDEEESIASSPVATTDESQPDTTQVTEPEKPAAPIAALAPATSARPIESDTPPPRSAASTDKQPAAIRDEADTKPGPASKDTVITEKTDAIAPPVKSSSASAPNQPHREDWLLKQQPTAFTLQLLGSREQASISTYIKRNALEPSKTSYYRGRYRDADWHVLLHGIYPDKAAALAARSALPEKVQKAKPWPRSLKSVQDSIQEAP
jgi:DamX protein